MTAGHAIRVVEKQSQTRITWQHTRISRYAAGACLQLELNKHKPRMMWQQCNRCLRASLCQHGLPAKTCPTSAQAARPDVYVHRQPMPRTHVLPQLYNQHLQHGCVDFAVPGLPATGLLATLALDEQLSQCMLLLPAAAYPQAVVCSLPDGVVVLLTALLACRRPKRRLHRVQACLTPWQVQ